MLAALLLAAVINDPGPTSSAGRTACPVLPVEISAPNGRTCDAIELTGRVDATSVSLDPAFNTRIAETEMARPAPGPDAIVAYDKNGNVVFTFPFTADGDFHLVLPLATQYAAAISRITLTANGATFERVSTAASEPSAEAVAVDDTHFVLAWNAREYPGLHVSSATDHSVIASVLGKQTYEQAYLKSRASRLIVSFSDGVRSFTRSVVIFGRR